MEETLMAKKLFVLFVISCFFSTAVSMNALASNAQSADISSNKHDTALILAEDLIAGMQADEETPLLDNIACVITALVGLLDEVPACHPNDLVCIRTAIFKEINNLVECVASEDSEGLLFATCNIDAFLDGIKAGFKCESKDKTCIASAFFSTILDFFRCVSVAIGSGPVDQSPTSN